MVGVALSLPGKKDASTTNLYPLINGLRGAATTESDPA